MPSFSFRCLQRPLPQEDQPPPPLGKARVTTETMRIFREPSYFSEVVDMRKRNQVISIFAELNSDGPANNTRWYKVVRGYAHTAYLQRVSPTLNEPVQFIPNGGQLFEITVPSSRSMRYTKAYGWQKLYTLYYQSVHWVTGIEEGPDGEPWYRLTDDLLKVNYHLPASHMRAIYLDELTPISPEVDPEEKHIEVSLKDQTLTAYEGDKIVLNTKVSTGLPDSRPQPNGIPTITPSGWFNIQLKMPVRHMGDGALTDDVSAYELPGVPWVCFFAPHGVALHGTYWHDNFGREMSHGCVNMRPEDAKWIFRWSTPVNGEGEWQTKGRGTSVHVY